MDIDIPKLLAQLGILILGCSAVWLIGRPEYWRRWGYILGLCSQPFWIYSSIRGGEWGVLILSFLYTYSWAQGVWFHWFKLETVQPEDTIVPPPPMPQEVDA